MHLYILLSLHPHTRLSRPQITNETRIQLFRAIKGTPGSGQCGEIRKNQFRPATSGRFSRSRCRGRKEIEGR